MDAQLGSALREQHRQPAGMGDDRHHHRGGRERALPAGFLVAVYWRHRRGAAPQPLLQPGRIEFHKGEEIMKQFALVAALALASSAAFAFHCPADMKKIDAALANQPQLSAQQMAEVQKYRAEGEALHKAGKHQDSVDTLARAMKILNIK